jgi:hypothetical protein
MHGKRVRKLRLLDSAVPDVPSKEGDDGPVHACIGLFNLYFQDEIRASGTEVDH